MCCEICFQKSNKMASTANMRNGENTILYLSKIPAHKNTTVNLCNHFYQFGDILHIERPLNEDESAAAITFSTREAAQDALDSSDIFLKNRSIKMKISSPRGESTTASTSTPKSATNSNVQCDLCKKTFVSDWHLNAHMTRKHGNGDVIKCTICDETFPSIYAHTKHCCAKHTNTNVRSTDDVKPNMSIKTEPFAIFSTEKSIETIASLKTELMLLKETVEQGNKRHKKSMKKADKAKKVVEEQLQGEYNTLVFFAFIFQKTNAFCFCPQKQSLN